MIAAILPSGVPVEVEDAMGGVAQIRSLSRENIDQHYVGGEGYQGTKFSYCRADLFQAVVAFDPEECEPLANWIAAMEETDRLAEEHSSAVSIALEIEEAAHLEFIRFVHKNSLHQQI